MAEKVPEGETASQLLPVQLCSEAEMPAVVSNEEVTPRVCEGGALAEAATLKLKTALVRESTAVGTATTFRLMGMVCAPAAVVMVMVPLQVVPAVRPVWSTCTVKLVAVGLATKLPVGVRINQLLSVQLSSVKLAVATVFAAAVTARVSGAGTEPPARALKV